MVFREQVIILIIGLGMGISIILEIQCLISLQIERLRLLGRVGLIPTAIIIAIQMEVRTMTIRQDIMVLHSICSTQAVFRNMFQMVGVWRVGQQAHLQLQAVITQDKAVLQPQHQHSSITQFLDERSI